MSQVIPASEEVSIMHKVTVQKGKLQMPNCHKTNEHAVLLVTASSVYSGCRGSMLQMLRCVPCFHFSYYKICRLLVSVVGLMPVSYK